MSARYQPIDQTLRRARSALRRDEWLRAAAVLAIALGAVLLLGIGLASLGVPVSPARPWYLGAAGATMATALFLALRPLIRPWTDDAVARRIGDRDARIGDGLLSAVQLNRDADELARTYALSSELIERHVGRTAEATADVDPRALPDRRGTLRLVRAGGGTLFAWVLVTLVFPGIAARSRALLFGSAPGMHALLPVPAPTAGAPRLGDVTVTYRYPHYTGREPKTLEGTDGALEALKGTVAEIRLRSDREVKSAQITLDGKDRLPLAVTGNRLGPEQKSRTSTLTGEISILENGSWTVEAIGTDGARAANDAVRTITALPDEVPTAQLVWPANPDLEVNELEDVDVVWGAEDDYGLRQAVLVWQNHPPPAEDGAAAAPKTPAAGRIPLASFSRENPTRHGDKLRWSLATLKLEAGGFVEYWVEVTDNDTISGPKRGKSRKQRLHLLSSSQIHDKVIALQELMLKRMVHYLADHLEIDPGKVPVEKVLDEAERFEGKARDLSVAIDEIAKEMLKDPLGEERVYDQIMKIRANVLAMAADYSPRSLGAGSRGGPDAPRVRHQAFSRAHGAAVPVLEKDILFLDKLIEKQRFDGARDQLQKMVAEQKDLREMLKKYEQGGMEDSELAKALEQRLAELQKRMEEIARKMASTLESMPRDFDNSAMREDAMSQIRKAIEEGRMDDAAALTEQMLDGLDQMLAQMDQMEDEFNLDPETARQLGEAQAELADLADKQKQVLDETDKVRDQIQKRVDQDGKRIDEFAKKQLEKVEQLRNELDRLERQGIVDPWMRAIVRSARNGMERDLNGLEGGLKSGELGEALSHASDIENTLQGVRDAGENMKAMAGGEGADPKTLQQASRAQAKAKEIVDDLENLRAAFEDSATPAEKQRLSELGKSQAELRERAQGLAGELGELAEKTPFVPGEAGQAVQGAAGAMGEAAGKLRAGNAAGAMPSERQAHSQLGEAQSRMQGSGGSGGGRGTPLAQRMGGHGNRGQNGSSSLSNEDVEIPDGSQFRVPKEFREDILEAMKKPSPDGYQQLNQEYYERLIK